MLLQYSSSISGRSFQEMWQLEQDSHRIAYWGVQQSSNNSKATPGSQEDLADAANTSSAGSSMPSLISSKASQNEDGEEDEDESDSEGGEDVVSIGSDWDDEEEVIRDLLREAMDTAHQNPDVFDPTKEVDDEFIRAEERKGNPFIKLLGNLRGTLCSIVFLVLY
jgi:hypothetical protein